MTARVLLALQQPGDELELVGPDDRRHLLEPQVGLEPVRQQVAVLLPPDLGVGLAHELQDRGALGLDGDPVEGEQVDDVALLEPDAPQLQTADLGVRGPDGVAGLLAGDPGGLPEPPELRAEHDAGHGGPVVLARTARTARGGRWSCGRRRPPTR